MKKILLIATAIVTSTTVWAGGLLTNSNQSAAFGRMMARGATTDIDAIYSNPAGTAFNTHEGWTLSYNNQSAFQHRDILSTFDAPFLSEDQRTKEYEGTASAPILPSAYALYKKNKWAFQAGFGVTGGGGKASFDDGLPMFDDAVMTAIWANSDLASMVGTQVTPDMYSLGSSLKGRQYVFGLQLGASYRFNDHFSGHVGGRINYFSGKYEGGVSAMMNTTTLASVELDCSQTGWGVTPIIGVNYKVAGLTLAAKYEFKTNLNIENDTKTFNASSSAFETALADYKHGVNTPNDLPAILYVAAGYEILPDKLRAVLEYHFYDDKHAGMAHDKQEYLTRGTNEYLAGVEWDINKIFTVSAGGQITDYGLIDEYQSQTSFSCDSYSIGFGGAVNLTSKLRLNVSYFWTTYSDYTKQSQAVAAGGTGYCGTPFAGTDVYSRTNKVFGLGIEYKF